MSRLAIACLVLVLGVFSGINAQTCPIKPEDQDLDFSAVATACANPATICSSCTCALIDAYRPALVAGGITFDPKDPSSFPLEATTNIIRNCSEQYIVSMFMANVNVTALSSLTSCNYTANDVPTCLGPAVSAIAAGNATVKATSREADAAVPAGTTTLRVATVQKQGDIVLVTLAGQLSSAAQLVQTMVASQELMAALPAAASQQLQSLVATASSIDSNPNTPNTLAALANPIDAVALINSLAQLAAASPAQPAAAPAPAPAPANNAVSARPVLAAVASMLLLAALL